MSSKKNPPARTASAPAVPSAAVASPVDSSDGRSAIAGAAAVSQSGSGFPIVGIGASAGGLAAFEAFFTAMPVDLGMAFVLVQHLSPDHKSILAELIRRYTRLPVFEVTDGMVVAANGIYIIPPNQDMAFFRGTLQLLAPTEPRGQRLPIDFFFRSLALDQGERAIGIVLSGTASDGSLGVRAIKEAGGMVMVQTPGSAEFDGMPRSAIATGVVDYQCTPGQMPTQLISYVGHAFNRLSLQAEALMPMSENAMKKIFMLLRAQTGHDFSFYKAGTIERRIGRRMSVHQFDEIAQYVKFLQQTPAEVETLFRELLIGVTSFFREPDAFALLEQQIIPRLFAGKAAAGAVVRVWVAGCSTGEEAYTIAILLQECMETLRQSYTCQIFATDIDSRAIATARIGRYPVGIAADVSPLRLSRFFVPESDGSGYRVHKGIRDMLVFSEQDLIKDPPFSRLDLISCRNLLIYMDTELQRRLIPMFHYALNPNGMLFLGTSEGVGDFQDLFAVLDRKARLYQRKNVFAGLPQHAPGRFLPVLSAIEAALPRDAGKSRFPVKLPLRELTEQALLNQLAPAAALVNDQGDLLYLHGRTGRYLEPPQGEVSVANILQMARDGLRLGLSSALRQAAATQETASASGLSVKTNGHLTPVNVSVHPVATGTALGPETGAVAGAGQMHLYLVTLGEALASSPPPAVLASAPAANHNSQAPATDPSAELRARVAALSDELRARDEYLRSTHEELESSNEELKSSNEEMQSVNEELQSTNEELETSKEELQSLNEELSTVNNELNLKVDDLSRLNNDMNNLLAGTGIATVFVDHQLRILRFTPTASELINLITGDVGRPVGHIVSNLAGYNSLVADTQTVLDTLVPYEVEVQTHAGKWFMLRIRPYRTLDNVIEGAVIAFMDISRLKNVEEALAVAKQSLRLAAALRDAQDAITVQDLAGRTLAWNPGAVRLYGWSEEQALQMNVRERIPPGRREDALKKLAQLSRAEVLQPYLTQRLNQAGAMLPVSIISTALVDQVGEVYAIATTERLNQGGLP